MLNIVLAGVGGQGTVLAAKILAAAAEAKGWHVRTAETIGMAQRGGSVVSHVRLGDNGEQVFAPLVSPGTADLIVAFEPGEAARNLIFLAPTGIVVSATTTVEPVSAALGAQDYKADNIMYAIKNTIGDGQLLTVDDVSILESANISRKALNTVMLASAICSNRLPITIADLEHAVESCVRPKFKEMNFQAIKATSKALS